MHDFTNFRAALRRRILAGLGLSLVPAACGGDAGPGDTTGTTTAVDASTTTAAESSTSTDPTTGPTPADSSSAADSSSGETRGSTGPVEGSESTGSAETTGTTGPDETTSTATTDDGTTTTTPDTQDVERCFVMIEGACPDLRSAADFYQCTDSSEEVIAWLSGPVVMGDLCCYQVDVQLGGACIPGRPFVVDGEARLAPIRVRVRGWQARPSDRRRGAIRRGRVVAAPALGQLDPPTRARLGRAWAEDAAFEHASVASFGKLALELLAFGAPAELVRAAHEAALSEVRHAELCFALASDYLGAPVGPGALVEAASFTGARTLAELAAAAVREGCVGETLAAAGAAAQHEAATDGAVRAALAVIAADEGGHAELAYRIVAWALASGDAGVRLGVREAFHAALEQARREDPRAEDPVSPMMRAHGRLARTELTAERRRAADEVILPAMARLLGSPS
jgi:hypothetical protein